MVTLLPPPFLLKSAYFKFCLFCANLMYIEIWISRFSVLASPIRDVPRRFYIWRSHLPAGLFWGKRGRKICFSQIRKDSLYTLTVCRRRRFSWNFLKSWLFCHAGSHWRESASGPTQQRPSYTQLGGLARQLQGDQPPATLQLQGQPPATHLVGEKSRFWIILFLHAINLLILLKIYVL